MNVSLEELENSYRVTYNYRVIDVGKYNHHVLNMDDINNMYGTTIPTKNQSIEALLQNPVVNGIKSLKSMISIISRTINEYEAKDERDVEEEKDESEEEVVKEVVPEVKNVSTIIIQDISKNRRLRMLGDIFMKLRIMKHIFIILIIIVIIFIIIELPSVEIKYGETR